MDGKAFKAPGLVQFKYFLLSYGLVLCHCKVNTNVLPTDIRSLVKLVKL